MFVDSVIDGRAKDLPDEPDSEDETTYAFLPDSESAGPGIDDDVFPDDTEEGFNDSMRGA